jgi:hypothetical protein
MRLRLIQKVLESTTPELNILYEFVGGDNFKISGLVTALNAVHKIEDTGVLKEEVQQVLSVDVSISNSDSLVVSSKTYNSFTNSLNVLRDRSNCLSHALKDLIQDDSQEIILFKLPEPIQLDELTHLIEDLKKVLEQSLVNQYVNGRISFQGFDRGSAWLEIGLGSVFAIETLGRMVQFIHNLLEAQKRQKAKEIMIQDLDLQLEARQSFNEALKKELDSFTELGMNQLLRETGAPETDHELGERFKYSIQVLSHWMERGLEVHPSLTSTPETQRLFPDAERILAAMKLLPSGVDE